MGVIIPSCRLGVRITCRAVRPFLRRMGPGRSEQPRRAEELQKVPKGALARGLKEGKPGTLIVEPFLRERARPGRG